MSVRFPVLSKYDTQSNKGLSFLKYLALLLLNMKFTFFLPDLLILRKKRLKIVCVQH